MQWEGEAPAEPKPWPHECVLARREPRPPKANARSPRRRTHGGNAVSSGSSFPRQRKHPAHGVLVDWERHPIVLVTVCTRGRSPWLGTPEVHELLCDVWRKADAWAAGRYVLMPDHIHVFSAPTQDQIELDSWVQYWKSQFTKRHRIPEHRWQTDHWDTRLRSAASYDARWEYVRHNPVRAGLVAGADEWPFQGELNVFWWPK